MKILLFILSTMGGLFLNAQTPITKYYDSNWMLCPKEKAVFHAIFIKQGDNYNCTSYWIKTNTIRGKSTYPDTVMQAATGLQTLYFKNGQLEDSSFFENKLLKYTYHYFPNKQLEVYYHLNNKNEGITDGYDESGNKIKNYIFQKDAEFKGGPKAWTAYLGKNATSNLHVKSDTDIIAKADVEFIINENGDVFKPKIRKSSGYKNIDTDALRLISDSPQWNVGILYNKPIKSYKIQPITYILKPEK